jgi:hypothetical protein
VAKLRRLKDGAEILLAAQTLLGRRATSSIVLDEPFASSEQARIGWGGGGWILRDLGSRNGTFADGERIEAGQPLRLTTDTKLGFGAPEISWEVIDLDAPLPMAVKTTTRETRVMDRELLVLPDDLHPEVSIYPAANGIGWILEADGDPAPITDQTLVTAGGAIWRLELPQVSEATPMVQVTKSLGAASIRFGVSRDEETVEIGVVLHGIEHPIEPREHGYLLLTLARARQEDRDRPEADRGWRKVSELERMLRMDSNALNVAVHRARQQLAELGLEGAAGIVEVRRGERRLGTERFKIGGV